MDRMIRLFTALMLSICALQAQQSVQGIVLDTQGKAIEYVNIVAMRQADSTFVSGCVTDAQGGFKLDNLPSGCYLLFSSIGYQKQSLRATKQMRVILLEAPTKLSEVSVVAHSFKERPGGYTMQIQNTPLMQGKKLLQALELLPHIHIEAGKVNILNRAVEAIYVDGLRLQDTRELNTLPLEQIDRVEVDYTSSVREGANATGGVLRIFLRKQANAEWSANMSAETYYMPHYGWRGGSIDNYLSGRWAKLTLRNAMSVGKQLFLSEDETSNTNKRSGETQRSLDAFRNWTSSFYDRLSISYQLASKHLLASSLLYSYDLETPEHTLTDLLSNNHSYQRQHNPVHLWQWLNTYKWTMNPKTTLSLSTDLLSRRVNQSIVEQKPQLYTGAVAQKTQMYRIKPELQHQFKGGARLTLGGDLQWIRQDEKSIGLVETSMHSSMSSIFSTYASTIGSKLRYEIGLRFQSNTTQTSQAGRVYSHSYTSLYPSLSAMYLIDAKRQHLFNLSLRRVMETIPYSAISGYRQYSGAYNYSVGNPNLITPIGTQAMALLSLWGSLNFSLGLLHYKSPIYYERKVDSEQRQTTYTSPMNGKYQAMGIASLEWRHQIAKWWSIKTSAMLRMHSADAGIVVRNQVSSIFRHNSTFSFSPSFGAGLALVYEPTYKYLDRTMEAVGSISADIYKSLLKGKMDLRLNIGIYRQERSIITSNEELIHQYHNLTRSPSFTLSISYRLGNGTKIKALEGTRELQHYQKTEDAK